MKTKAFTGIALSLLGSNLLLAQTKPNVLYIMTDQQSYNMMSCMGNKWLSTPNMDKIARMGYRFDKTYCANPVCMPSRYALLTGHYGSEVGAKQNIDKLIYSTPKLREIVTESALGNVFHKAGYETLYSGKVHLYGTKDVSEYGFKLNNTDPYDGPAIYAEKVLSEMGKEKRDKPFLLFLSFLNPHDINAKVGVITPTRVVPVEHTREPSRILALQKALSPQEYRKQIPPRVPNTAPISDERPDMIPKGSTVSRGWDDAQWNLYSWMYYRLTESVDAQIGRVLTALEKSGLEDNTIIVFTSDHGEMNGAHGLIAKNVMFEECQHVPLIFAGKGIKRNYSDKTTLVCNGLDFLPTLCDLVGIQPPKGLSGISLKPFLTGEGKKPDRKYIVTESYNGYQINDGRYKFTIYEIPGHPETLTDLKTNPGETIDYINNPSYTEIKSDLKQKLMANLSQRGLTPLPDHVTNKNIRPFDKAGKAIKRGEKKSKINIEQ